MTTPLYEAALEIQPFCRSLHWSFCFIGGVAVQRWGEPRFTRDVGITVQTGFREETAFVEKILGRFEARISGAAAFAVRSRVVLARAENGIPIDIALGGIPFENRALARATYHKFEDSVVLRTCSSEDLIVLKAFTGRDRDWADIAGVLLRSGQILNRQLIRTEITPLLELKGEPDSASRLRALLDDDTRLGRW